VKVCERVCVGDCVLSVCTVCGVCAEVACVTECVYTAFNRRVFMNY